MRILDLMPAGILKGLIIIEVSELLVMSVNFYEAYEKYLNFRGFPRKLCNQIIFTSLKLIILKVMGYSKIILPYWKYKLKLL